MLKATRSYIEALTTGLTHESGIKFKEGKYWQADVKHRTLGYNLHDLQEMSAGVAKGVILHETGHLKYTAVQRPTPLLKKNPAMQSVYNAFEDLRMEYQLNKEYGEFSKEALAQLNYYGADMIAKMAGQPTKATKLDQILTGMVLASNAENDSYRDYIGRGFRKLTEQAITGFGNEVYEQIRDLHLKENLRYRLLHAPNTDELEKIIDNEVYPVLKKYIEEANDKPQQQTIEQQVIKKGHGAGAKQHDPENDKFIPSDKELETLLSMYSHTLAFKIKNILKEDSTIRYTGNYLQGKLLSKNAYRVLTGENRLFSRRNRPLNPDYAVTIVFDDSGSMEGKSHTNTYIGGYLLKMTCRDLGFPITYIKYNENARLIPDITGYREHYGGDNDDYEACELAYKSLDKRKKNIIFFLTDGGVCHDPTEIVQKINHDKIPFFAIGVGLSGGETEQLAKFYPNPISVPEVADIPLVLIGLLNKVIHR